MVMRPSERLFRDASFHGNRFRRWTEAKASSTRFNAALSKYREKKKERHLERGQNDRERASLSLVTKVASFKRRERATRYQPTAVFPLARELPVTHFETEKIVQSSTVEEISPRTTRDDPDFPRFNIDR